MEKMYGENGMNKIIIGNKDNNIKYCFRETCFGIVKKNDKFYITSKDGDYSLIGGGLEDGESHLECLKREFMEEAGLKIVSMKELCIIDCYWYTRSKVNMNSLSNIYIVEVSDDGNEPLEKNSELVKCTKEELLERIVLPYQKEAIKEYFK